MFTYRGPMYDHLTEGVVGISENTFNRKDDLSHINRKVSFLLVECLQNIRKHGKRDEAMALGEEGMFSFRAFSRSFYINAINAVKHVDRMRLSGMVEHINSLSREKLNALHKQQLQESVLSDKGGAGLGLIELARKSGQPITYTFEEEAGKILLHHQVFFKQDEHAARLNLADETRGLRHFMVEQNMLLCYKGELSTTAINHLLSITNHVHLKRVGKAQLKRAGDVLSKIIERALSRVSSDGSDRQGVMIIGETDEGLYMEAGNAIPSSYVNPLEECLDAITSCGEGELSATHTQREKANRHHLGPGLFEISKACAGRMMYHFHEIDERLTFFTLKAMI